MTAGSKSSEFTRILTNPLLAGILLGLAGFAGNWFKFTLFLNIDFLFGGFFVMTALLRYGSGAGIVASLIASSCTWLIWNHPYAMVIFTAETVVVGILNSRRNKSDLLLHDIIYWLICGAPLVWIFYHLVLGDSISSTFLIMLKQALNGVTNSLLASIFHLVVMSRKNEAEHPSFRQTVFIIMVSLALFPACFHLFSELRSMKAREDLHLAEQTERATEMAAALIPLVVPMISGGDFTGSSIGAVRTDELKQYLKTIAGGRSMNITVINQSGQVVASSRGDLEVMKRYTPPAGGSLSRVTKGVNQWIPDSAHGKNLSQRWAASLYLGKSEAGPDNLWRVVVENPYRPVLAELQRNGVSYLFQLLLLSVIIIPFSSFISFLLTRSISALQRATMSLPDDIRQNIIPELPESRIQDINRLMANFRFAALTLQAQHQSLSSLNQEIRKGKEEWERTFDSVPDLIAILDKQHKIMRVNRALAEKLGRSPGECIGLTCYEAIHDTDCPPGFCPHAMTMADGLSHEIDVNAQIFDADFLVTTSPLFDQQGEIYASVHMARNVSSLMQARKKAEESAERYRSLVEYAPFGIFINRDNVIEYANPATLELFGAAGPGEIVGRSPYDFFHPEYHALMTERINTLLAGGSVSLVEGKVVQLDGTVRHAEVVATAFVDSQGAAIQVMLHDISRRKENEKEIQDILERLSLAQKSAAAGFWNWDIQTGVLTWSPELSDLFGVGPATEASIDLWRSVTHPDDWPAASQRVKSAIEKRERLFNEYRILLPSKEVRWISAIGDTIYDDDGQPRRMSGICLDITLRRMAEERLNLLADIAGTLLVADSPQGAIKDLCIKTLAVLDCQLFFNFLADKETGRLHLNACSGLSHEEKGRLEWLDYGVAVCGCVALDGCRIVVEDVAGSSDPRAELVKSLGAQAYACHPLMMGEEVLGTLSFGSRTRSTFSNDDLALMKAVTNLVSIAMERKLSREKLQKAHDALEVQVAERTKDLVRSLDSLHVEMAERLKAEEELRTRERLLIQQSRLAAMGEMISNIAHQWRQPLNTLGLIVQRLPHFYDAGKFDREFLCTNTRDAMNLIRHMSATIDDFRDFFRPDKERVIFNVKKAVNQAVSLIDTGFKAQNIDLETRIEGEPTVNGYPSQFAQVILNILFNARDALLERGGDKGRIQIDSSMEGERLVLTIRDNAGGIPDNILDKVFDPYFTTKGPDRGTGIGLFMAKSIIEKSMGGSITACNYEDGAEFRIKV